MIRVAICDDELIIGSMLERVLLLYGKKNDIKLEIDVFESGEELLKNMRAYPEIIYDILFLDIELKEINGIEAGNQRYYLFCFRGAKSKNGGIKCKKMGIAMFH